MAPSVPTSSTSDTERAGLALAMPLVRSWCAPGTEPIDTNTFVQSEHVQRSLGDYVIRRPNGVWMGVEVKAEDECTGNLFVETWSNAVLGARERRGWVDTLRTDFLVAVYLDARVAVAMVFPELRDWWLTRGCDMRFPPRVPARSLKGEQRNLTLGHLVPFVTLPTSIRAKAYRFAGDGTFESIDLSAVQRVTASPTDATAPHVPASPATSPSVTPHRAA